MKLTPVCVEQWSVVSCVSASLRSFVIFLPWPCVYIAADLGEKEVTGESSGEFLTPCRHGPGSCLRTLVDFLSDTHNSLVREARRASRQEDRSVHQLRAECKGCWVLSGFILVVWKYFLYYMRRLFLNTHFVLTNNPKPQCDGVQQGAASHTFTSHTITYIQAQFKVHLLACSGAFDHLAQSSAAGGDLLHGFWGFPVHIWPKSWDPEFLLDLAYRI